MKNNNLKINVNEIELLTNSNSLKNDAKRLHILKCWLIEIM